MIAAARSSGKTLSQVFQYRYFRESLMAKALIDEGKLGRLRFDEIDAMWVLGPTYYDLWWRRTWAREWRGASPNERSTASSVSSRCGCTTFRATTPSGPVAAYTFPIPPDPSSRSMR